MENISFDITAFMGKARGGKTISLVREGNKTFLFIKSEEYRLRIKQKTEKLSYSEIKRLETFSRFELWTNLKLDRRIYGNYIHITPELIMKLYKEKKSITNKLILLDDIFKEMDSRDFAKEKNKLLSYFVTEVGKKGNILKYVSHFTRNVEIRLRAMTENFKWCKKGKLYNLRLNDKKSFRGVWIEDKNYYTYEANPKILKQMIILVETYKEQIDFSKDYDISRKNLKYIEFFKAEKYFKHYDTGEIV